MHSQGNQYRSVCVCSMVWSVGGFTLAFIYACVYVFVCKGGLWQSEGEAFEAVAVIKGAILCLLLIEDEDKLALGVKMDDSYLLTECEHFNSDPSRRMCVYMCVVV